MSEDTKLYKRVKHLFESSFPNSDDEIPVFQGAFLLEVEIHAHPGSHLKVG